jgi:hypothetical protein
MLKKRGRPEVTREKERIRCNLTIKRETWEAARRLFPGDVSRIVETFLDSAIAAAENDK